MIAKYADTSKYSESELKLWELLKEGVGKTYYTFQGLEFTFTIKGNEMFVSRKNKSITRAAVNDTYRKAMKVMEETGFVSGPKKIGTFGASYLYPIFLDMRLIVSSAQDADKHIPMSEQSLNK